MTARGQFVTVVVAGDYGKPRPALVVQSDLFSDLPSVLVCPLTATVREDVDLFRITVEPTAENGLLHRSQIAIDKTAAVQVSKVGQVIGRADDALMLGVGRALAVFLGIV